MKRALAAVLTLAVLGLLMWSSLRRDSIPNAGPPSADGGLGPVSVAPSENVESPIAGTVRVLLERARAGDIDGYLSQFSGPLRARLEREVAETGREGFATALRAASAARKGHAIFAPEAAGPDAARVVLESVYPDRNERQTFELARTDEGWRVVNVDSARGHEPSGRYGEPATFQGPEGNPLAGQAGGPSPAAPSPVQDTKRDSGP